MVIEEERLISSVGPFGNLRNIFIEHAQMRRNWCMKSRNYFVKNLFLTAHLVKMIGSFEAVLLVDKRPDIGAIVSRERFDILVHIEVFTLIILLIFNMPDPLAMIVISLLGPNILVLRLTENFISGAPALGNISLITTANSAALRFANLVHVGQRAFGV